MILDVVILAILGGCVFLAYRKGLIKMFFDLFSKNFIVFYY